MTRFQEPIKKVRKFGRFDFHLADFGDPNNGFRNREVAQILVNHLRGRTFDVRMADADSGLIMRESPKGSMFPEWGLEIAIYTYPKISDWEMLMVVHEAKVSPMPYRMNMMKDRFNQLKDITH